MSSFTSSVSIGWADNMKISTLNAALKLNSSKSVSMQSVEVEKFWSTPARFYDSDTHECMEVTLSNVRIVNHIKLEIVKFPHDLYLECFDLDVGDWVPLYEAEQPGDMPCGHEMLDCNPPVIPPIASIPEGHHPQHSFNGHWAPCEWLVRPRRFQRVRVVLKRHGRSKLPCGSTGKLVAFSLAVRNLYCGYKIYSKECVPRPEPVLTSVTEHQEFSQSTDILGSAVSYSIRINRAENILRNDPATTDNSDTTLIWRCEPQPFPWAVVNYFMDVRDDAGGPQVLDRFYIDPLNEGPNVNLYYSNDEPDANFVAPDTPLPPQIAVINGQIQGTSALSSTTTTYGRTIFVDIDNTPITFIPGRRWWLGGRMNWRFQHSIDILEHPVFDCGHFHLAMTRYGMRFATVWGDYFYLDCDEFQPANDFTWMCWYDGNNRAHLRINVNGQHYHGHKDLTVRLTEVTVDKLRIAGFFGWGGTNAAASADFNLRHMVLKIDEDVTQELQDDFLANPEPYVVKPEFDHQDDGRTQNAILRYSPDFVSTDFPSGFKGGGPTRYSAMTWSPIARDFRMAKGFLQFPPTKAKYWKFEFCDLVPESYEVYVPIKKQVKTYTTEMWSVPVLETVGYQASFSLQTSLNVSVKVPGLSSSVSIASSFSYSDTRVSIGSGVNVSIKGSSNTMVRVATNQVAVSVLSSVSWAWNFMPIHKLVYVPKFEQTTVHTYEYIDVEQSSKIAYFVGLKYVQPYRVDYLSVEDTNQYIELFQDTSHIDSDSGFVLTEDHVLSSGDTRFAQAQSKVMPSSRIVRAVQFATTQSAPLQLLPDDDFDDPDHTAWHEVGDGALAPFTTQEQAVGSVLRVDRSTRNPSWDEIPQLFITWSGIAAQAGTYDLLEAAGNPAQAFGGIESGAVDTPPGGRIYAAARVIAPAALASPLYVQIVDDDTGRVLSETAQDVAANQITEWHTSYTVGEGGDVLAWRWRDFATAAQYASYVDTFGRANAASLGTMTTGQVWQNAGTPHTVASLIAVTSTVGGYDYVDGLTPWGTYEIVVGTMGTGAAAQLMSLNPLQIDDAGVLTYQGGKTAFAVSSVFGRAVQANDDLRIDVLPTALVPSNRLDSTYTDVVSAPYTLVFYLNGTWIKSVAHRMGAKTLRGILGRLNQQFKSFSWLPASYGPLPGPVMNLLPIPGNGNFDTARLTWVDNDSVVWSVNGTWDNSTTAGALVATQANSRFIMDSRYWYGTLSAWIRHVSDGPVGGSVKHGNVLALDDDNRVFLNYAGNIVQDGVSFGNVIPGGVTNASFVQISFLDTKSVAASIRGAIDPAVYPRMLVARVNGTVVGTHASAQLQTWGGTRRGLAGDAYNSGLDAQGNPNALPVGNIADLHTSFESFGWAPDASVVVLDPRTPKWDEISQRATGTYDSLAHFLTLNTGSLRARVIQRSPSIDVWDMDTLSMFADPIVWSFSNDGGGTFYNAFDTRNNPNGVLTFPDSVTVTSGGSSTTVAAPGQALVWRVVSYAPHSKVSSLTIRPWYGGLLSGVTHRVGINAGGPNVMPYDHYPSIEQDARFQTWHDPVPQDWYYQFRILARSKDAVVPPPKVLLVPETLTSFYKDEV